MICSFFDNNNVTSGKPLNVPPFPWRMRRTAISPLFTHLAYKLSGSMKLILLIVALSKYSTLPFFESAQPANVCLTLV